MSRPKIHGKVRTGSQGRLESATFDPRKVGRGFQCPICKTQLAQNEMGYRSHLTKHINAREITSEQAREMRVKKFPIGTYNKTFNPS
jgi:hypothetical protein